MTYGIFVSFREAAQRLFVSDGAVKHEVRDGEVLRGKAGAVGKRLRR